jgi:Recombination endonuclease VII
VCGQRKVNQGRIRCSKCADYISRYQSLRMIRKEDKSSALKSLINVKKCGICGRKKPNGKNWHTDHSHKTRKFRGILCHSCNIGLGHFMDSIRFLQKAISYLRKPR